MYQQSGQARSRTKEAAAPSTSTGRTTDNSQASERLSANTQTGIDPRGYTPSNGSATTQAPIDVGDSVNAPAEAGPSLSAGEKEVRVLHDTHDTLCVPGTPAANELYEERESTGECTGDWDVVTAQIGSVDQPSRLKLPIEDALFVDGVPSIEDIHQGGLADCYFLASIAAIIQTDPARISGMINVAGGKATVEFFRFDTAGNNWVPCTITVDTSLAQHTDGAGGTTGLVGAGFRMGESPYISEWHADVTDDALWVAEDAYYEVAMWAPLLEKAYARYIERFGQYGGYMPANANASTDAAGNALSGYEIINGGMAEYSYPIIYGPDAVNFGSTDMNYTPGADLVAANLPAIQNLLRVGGDGVAAGQAFDMTVAISRDDGLNRLDAELEHTLNADYISKYHPAFARHLTKLRGKIGAWSAATTQPDQDAAMAKVSTAAAAMIAPGAWPVLDSDREGGDFRDLSELLLMVRNITTDGSTGQRSTYAWHSYTVLGSTFADSAGAPLAVNLANLATTSAQIDAGSSHVQLRNPHGTNEPDQDASGPSDGKDDGTFSMSLEQFFRAFAFEQHGVVRT